ncbi:DEAD/DEAH box helicase [Sphingomonas sp. PL20]|uniref:DEAD/DEAH box helicase n=1 Tax=Sphingomonas sp. PL20 TaxID=2760712 RepID=UPI001AE4F8ED
MDVFSLNNSLLAQYTGFARSFTRIRSSEILEKVTDLYAGRRFWPEPMLQLNPHYEGGGSVLSLVGPKGLIDDCAEIFRDSRAAADASDKTLKLRRHQEQAIGLALDGKSFVVTTGTGSGKSLCFFIPIVDAVVKAKRAGEAARTRAVVIYPMNALANSQLEELKKFLADQNHPVPVTFARYTGQENSEERERIKNNPPDILLTNFMMLELLMTRQSDLDRRVVENCSGLRFIVLDELHTYRGRQGADVAMLMRRLRARVGDPQHPPICIGTSATMASEGGEEDRNQVVADVASRLFGTNIGRDAIVTETLRRATDPDRSADRGLSRLSDAVVSAASATPYEGKSNGEIARDDLAIWVETRLGLRDVDQKPRRARSLSLKTAAVLLSGESSEAVETCELALKNALLAFSLPEKLRGYSGGGDEPLFAFKLHQFISGAGRLYTTLDPSGSRTVTFDGQIFDPENPEKRLYSAHFCRRCGQENHPVTLVDDNGVKSFEKREIDDVPLNDDEEPEGIIERWGFLMPEPVDGEFTFQGRDEDYPEAWLEETKSGELRLKATYRKTRAELVSVLPDGTCGIGGQRAWFMPGKFKFCPACGEHHSDSTRDINRLAALSAEGRSSATTIIIAAILRWMSDTENSISATTRKLLAFTDNRQDAALQAGHFNDFLFVTLLRGAVLAAVSEAGDEGLQEDEVGKAIQRMLGFVASNVSRRTEWLVEPDLKGANLLAAEKVIRESLTHRFWIDQRRGWRYTNPNLEQLGLIEARYISLDDLAHDDKEFENYPLLRAASALERQAALRVLLDVMRKGLAVECDALDRLKIESLAGRMRSVIKAPWILDEERFLAAPVFMPKPPTRREMSPKDEELILRGSPTSTVGRQFRSMTFGGRRPTGKQITEIVEGLLKAAGRYGLATQVVSPVGGDGWRLVPSSIAFALSANQTPDRDNPFFRGLYGHIATLLADGGEAIFGFEGREHTAQVEGDLREIREARFRYGVDDRKLLIDQAERLKELREDSRFLPTLFCSPTMELGVDISSMNVVYMRNVPPTPANYAQRGGRAGRSGQAALIVTYCAAQSPHDQYFFQRPSAMVDGVVLPPSIDLKNPELVESHLHAEWLAASGAALSASIADNLDMTVSGKPLLPHHWNRVSADEARSAGAKRVAAVLSAVADDYGSTPPDWFVGVDANTNSVVAAAPQRLADTFNRWRDLLAAAERQVEDAARTLKDYSISPQERRAAETRQAAGNTQIKLLLRGAEGQGSDFYVYRYLATEGFLPGYNFPRLPIMAFVPGDQGGKGQRYIQRARFLAIAEFGPGSLVYHEGRAYRVDRALLKEVGGGQDGLLPTFSTAICAACGAAHDGEPPERCHVCNSGLSTSNITKQLHRIENVGTRQVERITANDEERRRQGYELQTTFSFRDASDVRSRVFEDSEGHIFSAEFAPAAQVRRINRGLRRRKDISKIGFLIDPKSGYWASDNRAKDAEEGSPINSRQPITPVVEDRKNALLIRFPAPWLADASDQAEAIIATIQHAFARGIEAIYQLEEGEIQGEPTPSRKDRRALLFYEAAEGGAGVLSRLVEDGSAFRAVAKKALEIMHYASGSLSAAADNGPKALENVEDSHCVAGCYRCLLSYFNQPDHELIDRRREPVLQMLIRLSFAEMRYSAPTSQLQTPLEGCPPPDAEPIEIGGYQLTMIWRVARVAAAEQGSAPATLSDNLAEKGIELFLLPADIAARQESISKLAIALGAKSS